MKTFLKTTGALLLAGVVVSGGWWYLRQMPTSPSDYQYKGKFGPRFNWPLIPVQVVMLPDGRLLSFGSDDKGSQGSNAIFDVWDPAKGFGDDSHLTLPNVTKTDIFCSGQLIIPSTESVMIVGGDRTVNGERNWSNADVNFFSYKENKLSTYAKTMARPRWYPTVMTLSNGEVLVLGGRLAPNNFAPIPEIYNPASGWRQLPGADKDFLFGSANWNYPRAWQMPSGKVYAIHRLGKTYEIDVTGDGSFKELPDQLLRSHVYLPSLMYAPGKILSIRLGGVTNKIDLNGAAPVVKSASWAGLARINATATVMADGKVFLSGGGLKNNDSGSEWLADKTSAIWDPEADSWSTGAVATEERLYHSTALLMQDGTVFTGGGGASIKSAKNQLNGEIYYPPYLFKKDGSGDFASRPVINRAPNFASWKKPFELEVAGQVSRVTLIKMGSATHAQVYDQRFAQVPFTKKSSGLLSVTVDHGPEHFPPGYYYLFVFDLEGVPSVAKIIKLDA